MKLNDEELNELCTMAKKAAIKAGMIIEASKSYDISLNKKDGGENIASCVVTEVDLKSQEVILDFLKPTVSKYDLGLLTEEASDEGSRFTKDYFWCIDPLDGTLAYSKKQDGYSTAISLVNKEGQSIIGVVYNSKSKTLYHAIKGCGAFRNNSPFKATNDSKKLTLFVDQSYLDQPQYKKQINEIKANLNQFQIEDLQVIKLGGAVMNALSTIEFGPALYFKSPKKALGGGSIWDFAASSVIHSEAGGFNSNYKHEPLQLNCTESTFMNTQGIIFSSSKNLLKLIPYFSCSQGLTGAVLEKQIT